MWRRFLASPIKSHDPRLRQITHLPAFDALHVPDFVFLPDAEVLNHRFHNNVEQPLSSCQPVQVLQHYEAARF